MADEEVLPLQEKPEEKDTSQKEHEQGAAKTVGQSRTVIDLANKIAKNEANESEKVDFRIHLAEVKSRILTDPGLDARGKTIRSNFMRKLEAKTLGLT